MRLKFFFPILFLLAFSSCQFTESDLLGYWVKTSSQPSQYSEKVLYFGNQNFQMAHLEGNKVIQDSLQKGTWAYSEAYSEIYKGYIASITLTSSNSKNKAQKYDFYIDADKLFLIDLTMEPPTQEIFNRSDKVAGIGE